MTKCKLLVRLTTMVFALFFSSVASTTERLNEYKNNRASNPISNADLTGHANSNASVTLSTETNTSISAQKQFNSYTQIIQQMKERHRQLQKDQLEAYERRIQNQKQHSPVNNNLPPDVQARREEYIKQMNERQEFINKMVNERRKAAQERKQTTLQKMHRTSTTFVTTDET